MVLSQVFSLIFNTKLDSNYIFQNVMILNEREVPDRILFPNSQGKKKFY